MTTIKVGTCGYQYYDPGDSWKDTYDSKLQAYSDTFDVGELNRMFYKLPQVSTADRWRTEVRESFEFVVKAWQAMTHPWSSPTWNNYRDAIPADDTDAIGYLQPSIPVMEAWDAVRRRVEALDARIVVLQTPPSFDCSQENEASMRELLTEISRDGIEIAWEPRGNWHQHPDRIASVCTDLDLIHVVDIFRDTPVSSHPFSYIRLHGRNDDRYDYDYAYSRDELDHLASELLALARDHDRVYCMFNNYEMYQDAATLRDVLSAADTA